MQTCDAWMRAVSVALAGAAVLLWPSISAAQVTERSDAADWSAFAQGATEPERRDGDRDHVFTELARGGPFRVEARGAMTGDARALMVLLAAGEWAQAATYLKESDPGLDQKDATGRTPLTLAIQAGQLPLVRELIRRGAPVDEIGLGGFTPLGLAAYLGQDLIARELIRHGADLDKPGVTGQPPLHLACLAGQERAVAVLLAVRPVSGWGQFNRAGRHALAEAAFHGQLGVVRQLQQAGFSLRTPDAHRLNALHAAALGQQVEMVRYLQTQGVPVTNEVTRVLIDQAGG